jgi:peptide subunit release factor 1 (eRF1)
VKQEGITQILTAGDEVILPLLREQMPKHLAEKVVDHLKVDTKAPLDTILGATVEAMAKQNEHTDREKVDAAIGAYRAGGLGIVGPEDTLDALIKGQVDELLLTATMDALENVSPEATIAMANDSTMLEPAVETAAGGEAAQADPRVVRLADELVTRAKQTAATVTFIEDAELLREYGGVAALLRFRV